MSQNVCQWCGAYHPPASDASSGTPESVQRPFDSREVKAALYPDGAVPASPAPTICGERLTRWEPHKYCQRPKGHDYAHSELGLPETSTSAACLKCGGSYKFSVRLADMCGDDWHRDYLAVPASPAAPQQVENPGIGDTRKGAESQQQAILDEPVVAERTAGNQSRIPGPDLARRVASPAASSTPTFRLEVFQHDWIPGFAAFHDDGEINETAKAHVVLNLGSLIAAVKEGDLDKKDLPYMIAESLMHEAIHALEAWAGVEFSEDRVEKLLEEYRKKYERATIWEYTGLEPGATQGDAPASSAQDDLELLRECDELIHAWVPKHFAGKVLDKLDAAIQRKERV